MSVRIPRYLVPFHPKHVPHFFTDVLVIGGGLAGFRTALAVDPTLSVLVITKDGLQQSNSAQAQGGIASVLAPDDRFEDHVADTIEAGGPLCEREVVERVVREGPTRIRELIEWGTRFDRSGDSLALGREGEVTSTGLHGANRLASNSLLEALVYGAHSGEGASREAAQRNDSFHALPLENRRVEPTGEPLNVLDIRNSLKSLMWRNVGVRRDADGLNEAREMIDHWCRYVLGQQFTDPTGWELQNMLTVARLMIQAALDRQETRGCHVRTDCPHRDEPRFQAHTSFRRTPEIQDP